MKRQALFIAVMFIITSSSAVAVDDMWKDKNGDIHFSDGSYFKNGVLHHLDGSYSTMKNGIQTHYDKNGKISGYARNNSGILETFDKYGKFDGGIISNYDGSVICYDDRPQKKCLIIAPDKIFEVDASGRLLNEYKTAVGR